MDNDVIVFYALSWRECSEVFKVGIKLKAEQANYFTLAVAY